MREVQWIGLGVIILVSIGLIFLVTQQSLPFILPGTNTGTNEKEWTNFQPKTCQEIPWRKAWSLEKNQPYDDFPLEDELEWIKTYYGEKGITILEAQILYNSTTIMPSSCNGCGCAEPFSFEVFVSREDAAVLAISGFTYSKQGLVNEVFGR
ncbi:MAG: hypothetical protein IPJ89_02740 [Candidatus Iainarchaeum archaeon]|uniref:Uncharacterized protein n=1 Tax=Candidatus Iainarchaeum sp. TaxID=3101447 RepID=A0A7T9DKT2_9ARCH|nr:MAG: hypothetical protein IPJ89_02740 [Candidatus Diapherotrites archaeon]